MRIAKSLLIGLTLVLILPVLIQAQTASITGTVTEPSGAVVPGAAITVRNTATNATRTLESNSVGSYRVENLAPGVYEVSAEKTGFKKLKYAAVTLTVAQVLTVDLALELGEVVETLEVNGQEIAPIELSTARTCHSLRATPMSWFCFLQAPWKAMPAWEGFPSTARASATTTSC
jgi:carboxypeptidase family protein